MSNEKLQDALQLQSDWKNVAEAAIKRAQNYCVKIAELEKEIDALKKKLENLQDSYDDLKKDYWGVRGEW